MLSSIRKNPVESRRSHAVGLRAQTHGRKRMTPQDRERHIVQGAIEFFSEHGLNGQLRELAQALGITHTLLYHYFPTKQALIDRVYEDLFAGRWRPEWDTLLEDETLQAPEKLVSFYVQYASVILEREWVRVFVYSGLSDRSITNRYFDLLKTQLFPKLLRVTRQWKGLDISAAPSTRESEAILGLHGSIFYMGIRRFVYGLESAMHQDNLEVLVTDRVQGYLNSWPNPTSTTHAMSNLLQEPL